MWRRSLGWPPLGARHFRERKRGTHVHVVLTASGWSSHIDEYNPHYLRELVPHLVHELWPVLRDRIWPRHGYKVVATVALAGAVFMSRR